MAAGEPTSLGERIQTRGKETAQEKISYDAAYAEEIKQYKKYHSILLGETERFLNTRKKLEEQYSLSELEAEARNSKLSAAEQEAAIEKLNQAREKITKESLNVCLQYAQNLNKRGTALERSENTKRALDALEQKKKQEKQAFEIEYANATGPERQKLKSERIKQLRETQKEEDALRKQQRELDNTQALKSFRAVQAGMNNIIKGDFKKGVGSIIAGAASFNLKDIVKNLSNEADAARKNLADKEKEFADMNDLDPQHAKEREKELSKYRKELQKAEAKEFALAAASAIVDKIGADYKGAFIDAEKFLTDYSAHFNARMQGTEENFNKMTDLVTSNLSVSPYVKTTKVLEKINEASDKGIAYNLELRSFLEVISDKIASTFDAFDANLLRLIRIQQADSTAARLGMEASLTRFFNSMYQDSSYLSGLSDSVAAAILDAESQLNTKAAAEFEYTVQKWLGSLSSLGMSEQAITNIAQGINYLATGDVTSLASNTSLQTLFAMSSNRAGLSYAELLTGGLNASNTNKLLEAMVGYLKEIAENADNQVVKGAYGNIFNMSLSDFQAISNLTASDISTIAGNALTYNAMQSELQSQMNQVITRMSLPEIMSNVYNNAMYGVASDMVNNPFFYATQKMLDFAKTIDADISIPFISAAGFGLDVNASVLDLVNMGLNIVKVMDLAGNILRGLGSRGGINLKSWGGTETTSRGGVGNLLGSMTGGLSGSTTVYRSNYNQSDTTNQTLSEATDRANENKKITNKDSASDEDDAKDANKALIAASSLKGNGNEWFWVRDALLNLVYVDSEKALRVIDEPVIRSFNRVVTSNNEVKTTIATSNDYLNVLVRNGELPVRITNVGELAVSQASASSKQTQTVSISGGLKIDKNTLMEAIVEALGLQEGSGVVSLGEYISAALDGSSGIVIKGSNTGNIPVSINGVGNTQVTNKVPVRVN